MAMAKSTVHVVLDWQHAGGLEGSSRLSARASRIRTLSPISEKMTVSRGMPQRGPDPREAAPVPGGDRGFESSFPARSLRTIVPKPPSRELLVLKRRAEPKWSRDLPRKIHPTTLGLAVSSEATE